MFREYQDVRIQRNLKYVKVLSLIALILWFICTFAYLFRKWYLYDWMISHPQDLSWSYICNFWGGGEFWREILNPNITADLRNEIEWDIIFCGIYFLLAFFTYSFSKSFSQKSLVWRVQLQNKIRFASNENQKESYKESRDNNDVTRIIPYIIFNLFPVAAFAMMIFACLIALIAGAYGDIANGVEVVSSHFGYMFLSHIFLLISSGFLIQNLVLIKREWRENPPSFLAEKMKKAAEEAKFIKIAEDTATCQKLLEECGMQFFVEYYSQIKRLPLRDVMVSDHYFPEREVRLTAAKKIIDLGLSEYALRYIIRKYGDVFSSDVIERAQSILNEIKNEKEKNSETN